MSNPHPRSRPVKRAGWELDTFISETGCRAGEAIMRLSYHLQRRHAR